MKHLRLLLTAAAAVLSAYTPEETPHPQMMVVEGWIESGAAPVVMVSSTLTPSAEKQSFSSLSDHIERWARVAVSDGTREVVLTGKPSPNHFPPYIYTTGRMFGEPGKTYTLTVDTDDFHCSASTVIPAPVPLESLEPVPFGDTEGGWILKAVWKDNPAEKNAYKFFLLTEGVDSLYGSSRLNFLDDDVIAGDTAEALLTPPRNVHRAKGNSDCFFSGQSVKVKFCSLDPACSSIMQDLDESLTQSGAPILVSNKNIQGNVSGALGYFVGFGRSIYTVRIP